MKRFSRHFAACYLETGKLKAPSSWYSNNDRVGGKTEQLSRPPTPYVPFRIRRCRQAYLSMTKRSIWCRFSLNRRKISAAQMALLLLITLFDGSFCTENVGCK